jgi:hypothetical protein
MASDRFVNWKKGKRPSKFEVETVIRQFFDSVATEIKWDKDRFMVTLVGKGSHPLKGIIGVGSLLPEADERWIEVIVGKNNLDVLTRRADEFTCCCANGLAAVFVRFWQAELDDD